MPYTLQELFQQGAHHTVESLIYVGKTAIQFIIDALISRFGSGSVVKGPVLDELVRQVNLSVNASMGIPNANTPDPYKYGINPALPDEFQYTVIGRITDPLKDDVTIEIPWTINSDRPLTYQEIIERANVDLNEGFIRPGDYNAAQYANLHNRELKFKEIVKERFGNEAPIDIEIIGAYRRE